MFAVRGRIQREGEVVHLVAQRLTDLGGPRQCRRSRRRIPAAAWTR
jgi:hypothetical protein